MLQLHLCSCSLSFSFVPTELIEPLSTHRFTGELSCYRRRPLCHSLFRGQLPRGGEGWSHCTWLMHSPCLLETVVKETLCLQAWTDPLSKLVLGPLSACLTGGVVGVWKTGKLTALAWYRDERSLLEKFKGKCSLTVDLHLLFSSSSFPACQPILIFNHFFPFLLHAFPLCLHLSYQWTLKM